MNACPIVTVDAQRIRLSARIGAQPGLEPAVIGFDNVVGVLLEHVPSPRNEVVDHARVDRCPVGRDLDRRGTEPQCAVEEHPRSRAVAALRQ